MRVSPQKHEEKHGKKKHRWNKLAGRFVHFVCTLCSPRTQLHEQRLNKNGIKGSIEAAKVQGGRWNQSCEQILSRSFSSFANDPTDLGTDLISKKVQLDDGRLSLDSVNSPGP